MQFYVKNRVVDDWKNIVYDMSDSSLNVSECFESEISFFDVISIFNEHVSH